MANYFNTCPQCGCNLDPGEKCDCTVRLNILKAYFEDITDVETSGQIKFKEIDYAR
jgi:hypothetical protein